MRGGGKATSRVRQGASTARREQAISLTFSAIRRAVIVLPSMMEISPVGTLRAAQGQVVGGSAGGIAGPDDDDVLFLYLPHSSNFDKRSAIVPRFSSMTVG